MHPVIQRIADAPRDKLLWMAIAALVAAQVIAFWMLCLHQVRKAEARQATAQVERAALADCMRYIPKATASGCAARITAQAPQPATAVLASTAANDPNAAAGRTAMSSAMPVRFDFR